MIEPKKLPDIYKNNIEELKIRGNKQRSKLIGVIQNHMQRVASRKKVNLPNIFKGEFKKIKEAKLKSEKIESQRLAAMALSVGVSVNRHGKTACLAKIRSKSESNLGLKGKFGIEKNKNILTPVISNISKDQMSNKSEKRERQEKFEKLEKQRRAMESLHYGFKL